MGSSNTTLMSYRVYFIHPTCVQHSAAAIYSASIVNIEIEVCFLLLQATNDSPKKNTPPLVLFLSSTQPAQYASE